MDDNQKLEIGMFVELTPGSDEVYPRAYALSRGIIRGRRKDDTGFDQVYIDWDKEHWSYNGEPNLWTFESHFRPIDGTNERELVGAEIYDAPSFAQNREEFEETEEINTYIESLMRAFDMAAESNGFFLITMKHGEHPELGHHVRLEGVRGSTDEGLSNISNVDILKIFAEQEKRQKE